MDTNNDTIKGMRLCPFCDRPATSQHHITPRTLGGLDEERNLIWLCQECHDEHEGKEFSPKMIAIEREKHLGKRETAKEEYHWVSRPGGELFLGIQLPGQKHLIGGPVFFPYNSQFSFLSETGRTVSKIIAKPDNSSDINPSLNEEQAVSKIRLRKSRGRPPIIISPDILLSELSLREKALIAGRGHMTIKRQLKKLKEAKRCDPR